MRFANFIPIFFCFFLLLLFQGKECIALYGIFRICVSVFGVPVNKGSIVSEYVRPFIVMGAI